MNRLGKAHEGIEEGMQSANKAWWRDVMIYRSQDVPWSEGEKGGGTRLQRLFASEAKIGPGPRKLSTESKGWETMAMKRLFRFK